MGSFEFAPAPRPDGLTARYERRAHQVPVSIGALMTRNRVEFGGLPAVFDDGVELTWRELVDTAGRFAGFLSSQGVGPGDVVAWQVPNWWESLVVAYGIWAAGAISAPVVPIYREAEVAAIVATVRPACVVTAAEFRKCRHPELVDEACRMAGWEPSVRVVLRGAATGWTPFETTVTGRGAIGVDVDPDAPALIGFTSGTTSGAKAVVHSTRGLIASPVRSTRASGTTWKDRAYMPAPVAHATGLLSAIAVPLYTGASVVLRDRWDADRAIDDIREHGVTTSAGAAVFMKELVDALDRRGIDRLPLSGGYPCGGSSIPTSLAEACEAKGLAPARAFGMTECPGVSGASPRLDPPHIRLATDGWIMPGCEVRVLGPDGAELPAGEAGEFLVRGPQLALGYVDPEHTREGFTDDGWFRTGDLGRLTAHDVGAGDPRHSCLVTGRTKEIINRGGEKISVREIEDALVRHAEVLDAAVVPAPHERLGEQPAAFVLLRPGVTVAEEALSAFLRQGGLAPQKIPRIWKYVDDLPRTASGKIKKYALRESLADPAA
ncbi:AMP-binding protein [Actinomadura syzygii]|uniref:Cyclohexanecarboxylate-CoA ligase n=1 Tax=Actinomadura syzygii TaxID=1427538 RepID=A0A5D0TT24_9ACTN|nr:AMP-binding protein [Actinomadura syzygii]TYC09007.1 cyclohexanecarboxylate-CoA ligase [Actinomadura syzygii]